MSVPQAEIKLRSLRVLLVEDSLVHQWHARVLLRRQGHCVTIVHDGREALEALHRDAYDVVLMDVEMPELDGLTTTRMIRHLELGRQDHLPIVAVTSTDNREDCYDAGMDAFLSKPLDRSLLERTLRRVVTRPTI